MASTTREEAGSATKNAEQGSGTAARAIHESVKKLRKQSRRDWSLRCWSAGCSTGQEPYTMAMQIADALDSALEPRGVFVLIEAEHLCMTMRGVKKAGATTVTSAVRGVFRSDARTRTEALELVRRGRP